MTAAGSPAPLPDPGESWLVNLQQHPTGSVHLAEEATEVHERKVPQPRRGSAPRPQVPACCQFADDPGRGPQGQLTAISFWMPRQFVRIPTCLLVPVSASDESLTFPVGFP